MAWHGYISVDELNLTAPQWTSIQTQMEALGPAVDPQPAHLCHWRVATDNESVIYEALFDDVEITVAAFKGYLATAMGVAVGTITDATVNESLIGETTPVVTLTQGGSDRVKFAWFAGTAATWENSRLAVLEFVRLAYIQTAYFVDATNGDDALDGRTPWRAWQTVAQVNGSAFAAGNQILFKSGETFRDELEPNNAGISGFPIVFDAYGDGADPIINGSRLVTTWTPTVGDEFSAACNWNPSHVYSDNTQLTLGAAAGALNADEYFWVGNVLHVRLASGDDPDLHTMEATYNVYNIDADYSYLTFRNLYCEKARTVGVWVSDNTPNHTNITFENVTSSRAGREGFRICGGGANPGPNNVALYRCTVRLWDRDNNQFFPAIYQREGDGSGGNNLVIQDCLVDGWIPWGVDTNLSRDGIRVDGGDGIIIHNNEITGSDHGILLSNTATGWDVAYNWIHEIGDDGIFYRNVDDADGKTYNNILYRCSDQFIDLQSGTGNFGLIANNTCYECLSTAISLRVNDGATATFKNNIFVITQNPSQRFVIVWDASSTVDIDDFVFDNNLYYDTVNSPVPNPFAWFESGANQTWAAWQAAGRDVNGITADPDLVSAGGTDPDDYKVNVGSQAIDNGETIAVIADDYEGILRPQGVAYDIGAFER